MKSSFSLIEVIFSFVILSLVIVNISKSFQSKSDNVEIFYELQSMENSFIENTKVESKGNIEFK